MAEGLVFVRLLAVYRDMVGRSFQQESWVRLDEIVAVKDFGDPSPGSNQSRVVLNNGQAYETTSTAAEVCAQLVEAAGGLQPEDLPMVAEDEGMRDAGWVRLAGVRAEVEFIRSLGADEGHVIETGWPEATAAFDRLWEGTSHGEA